MTLAALSVFACSPIVRPPPFSGYRDQVTDATLLGPFDGQIIDDTTGEPIANAEVVAVWSFDRGDGFVGPHGSMLHETTTDDAGRYRIPELKTHPGGTSTRLVSFALVVYKRGYVAYRSDRELDGSSRSDFTVRHNRIALRKWRDSDSHAQHLLFLTPPPSVQKQAVWEHELANLELYKELGGATEALDEAVAAAQAAVDDGKPEIVETGPAKLLDASAVLTVEDIRTRTGFSGQFTVTEPTDLKRTDFYHGVHFQAVDKPGTYDVIVRVWVDPPGGLKPVEATIRESLPNVETSGEVTDETWVFETQGVYAVGFLDRETRAGVLLTCGDQQCHDLATAIILARHVARNLDQIAQIEAEPEPAAKAGPAAEEP
ncbi:MAG: carboxypeptidase regulatory-like domain-containing protein [Myxococcales bacterium]|nr:carboxypeptidase regulatory-like domain-containing protein [Myxococcales bacterium]